MNKKIVIVIGVWSLSMLGAAGIVYLALGQAEVALGARDVALPALLGFCLRRKWFLGAVMSAIAALSVMGLYEELRGGGCRWFVAWVLAMAVGTVCLHTVLLVIVVALAHLVK